MDFSQALELLKQGRKVTRQRWTNAENRDQWIVRQTGYPEGIPLNRATAQATGLPEGSEQKFAPYYMLYTIYSTFVPWTPGHGDLNADDWEVYYLPGEKERLEQEETDAILADKELVAELDAAGKDPRTYSHDELKMVVSLRALEREDLADKEAIRFRLVRQLLRPVTTDLSQVDLTGPTRDSGADAQPPVIDVIRAFVDIITNINDNYTQAKLDLDATKDKLTRLEQFEEIWDAKYPVPEGLNSNDAIRAYQRIRYFQDGWKDSAGFTETTWRLISTLLAPMLEEWRQSHADTTGDFDPDRFKVTFMGRDVGGLDTIGSMSLETLPRITEEDERQMLAVLERAADPEATQRIRVRPLRPGDEAYPERPQRLTDQFPVHATFGPSHPGEEDPPVGPRKLRPSFPGETEPVPTEQAASQ